MGELRVDNSSERADKALPRNMELCKEIVKVPVGMPVRTVGGREPKLGLQPLATVSTS